MNSSLAKAQKVNWQKDRPLTWQDYKGEPDNRMNAVAITNWHLSYTYRLEPGDSTYAIKCFVENFIDSKSCWVKRAWMTDYILGHEQLHFDINELYARKLAAAFKSKVYTKNFKAELDSIFGKIWTESNAMEKKYDLETEYSSNKNMQLKWQLYIYLELEKLPRNY